MVRVQTPVETYFQTLGDDIELVQIVVMDGQTRPDEAGQKVFMQQSPEALAENVGIDRVFMPVLDTVPVDEHREIHRPDPDGGSGRGERLGEDFLGEADELLVMVEDRSVEFGDPFEERIGLHQNLGRSALSGAGVARVARVLEKCHVFDDSLVVGDLEIRPLALVFSGEDEV